MTQLLNVVKTKQEVATPEVGMGATYLSWTDRHAYTIISVSASGKSFKMQQDTARRVGKIEVSENQKYSFATNLNGQILTVRMTKNGWRIGGQRGTKVLVGVREEYYDYSF